MKPSSDITTKILGSEGWWASLRHTGWSVPSESSEESCTSRAGSAASGRTGGVDFSRLGERFSEIPVTRDAEVVVVGGGPSGLVAAYRLRHDEVLLMEAETEVGGNARAGDWHGSPWPMGAIVTYERSPAMDLYRELGLDPRPTPSSYGGTAFSRDGPLEAPLWEGGLEELYGPAAARSIRQARRELLNMKLEDVRSELDQRRLSDLLASYRPEVREFFDLLLAWFAGSTEDYSAYVGAYLARSQMDAGLGVLYPEESSEGGAYTFSGGLGRVTRALSDAIETAGSGRIWTDSAVFRIEPAGENVIVRGLRRDRPFAVRAKGVIVATPKAVARHIVVGLPEVQRKAMERLRYVPFLVAGIETSEPILPNVSAARILGGPIATFRRIPTNSSRLLYRCELPLGRCDLQALDPSTLEARAGRIVRYLDRICPGAERNIKEMRIWRRGLNWYIPVPGMVTEFQPRATESLDRIFFANADSLGPISEFGWAMLSADRAVQGVRDRLSNGTGSRERPAPNAP